MPDTPRRCASASSELPRAGLHRGQARLGPARRRTPTHDVELAARRDARRRTASTILIDAGPRLRRRRRHGDRASRAGSRSSASSGSRSRSSRTSTRRTRSSRTTVDIRVAAGEQDTTRLGLPRADRARPRRPRPARRDALRRHHRDAADRGARARARRRDRAARVEERDHQGRVAARERRAARRALPGVLHRRHADQPRR